MNENQFPVDPWTCSTHDFINAVTPENANLSFDGTPLLVIATLRAQPTREAINVLLRNGADPTIPLGETTLLEHIFNAPEVDEISRNECAGWVPPVTGAQSKPSSRLRL